VPLWYFTPFYAILRAIPDKLTGVIAMGLAIFVLFLLPWLDRYPVRSIRYRSWHLQVRRLAVFAVSFLVLGYLGLQPASGIYPALSLVFTVLYFAFFLLMPFYTQQREDQDRAEPG
jgi:ubiquinol-cytochrome c reductase cytochrome b subunit